MLRWIRETPELWYFVGAMLTLAAWVGLLLAMRALNQLDALCRKNGIRFHPLTGKEVAETSPDSPLTR